MVDRWTVERAIRDPRCALDPPARLLVLTLLTWVDHDTAMIPPRYTPSLSDLSAATGLARSTVAAWLNTLERLGWVVRARPSMAAARSKKARTVYALRLPADAFQVTSHPAVVSPASPAAPDSGSPAGAPLPPAGSAGPPPGPVEPESPQSAGLAGGPAMPGSFWSGGPAPGPPKADSGPPAGPALVRQPDGSGPPDGPRPYGEQNQRPVGDAARDGHRYIEGINGYCGHPGCGRSAPLHGRPSAVPNPRRANR